MATSSSNPASQPAIAPRLEEKIEAVRSEKLLADAERRRIAVRAKNEKARRMVRRLESCDGVSAFVRQWQRDRRLTGALGFAW